MNTDEKTLLIRHLQTQRRHVRGILEGLTDEQLRRPVLPSRWHCLGLVRHLTLSDEHYWFGAVVGGEPLDFPEGPGADWQVGEDEPAEAVLAAYAEQVARSDDIIRDTDLDAAPKWPDPAWQAWGMDFPDLRSILMHVITETAVHAGHLDAVRELIDGRQWIVLA